MKYNLSQIMSAAWRFFYKGVQTFAEALRLAWANAKTHSAAKASAGITEQTHTWFGWQQLGYEVVHGSNYYIFIIPFRSRYHLRCLLLFVNVYVLY